MTTPTKADEEAASEILGVEPGCWNGPDCSVHDWCIKLRAIALAIATARESGRRERDAEVERLARERDKAQRACAIASAWMYDFRHDTKNWPDDREHVEAVLAAIRTTPEGGDHG